MRVDQIEIHTGAVDFPYEPVRELEAKCEATTAFQKAPTMQDVNLKLQQLAVTVGANAVVNVQYDSGVSLTSWRSMKATGLAVTRATEDITCPVCAETIKRAAQKCRFCGTDLDPVSKRIGLATNIRQPTSARPSEQSSPASSIPSSGPLPRPLKSSDNPQVWKWIIVAGVALGLLAALAS